jgi:hypothetical protein
MLAGDQPAGTIARVPVGVTGWLSKHAHVIFHPTVHDVVRNVAPDEVIAICEVDGAFCPAHAGMELFHPGIAECEFDKTLVVKFEISS